MSRSIWKGPFLNKKIINLDKKILSTTFLEKNQLNFWCRNATIPSNLIGSIVFVHNGKEFKKIFISREKVGYKFGHFSFTRKHTHKQKNNK
jgi:small subunit ribosomal protein S19